MRGRALGGGEGPRGMSIASKQTGKIEKSSRTPTSGEEFERSPPKELNTKEQTPRHKEEHYRLRAIELTKGERMSKPSAAATGRSDVSPGRSLQVAPTKSDKDSADGAAAAAAPRVEAKCLGRLPRAS